MFNRMTRGGLALALGLLATAGVARAEAPIVATDIAPVQSLVARVMEGVGAPTVLVRPGVSPHGYAMRPGEAGALQEAEAIFWIGPELTPWLQGAIANLAADAAVTRLLDAPGTHLLKFRNEARFAPHDHADEADADGHDPDHSGLDPHAWLDPRNAQLWLEVIAERLAQLDPGNAQTYRDNAAAGQAEIAQLADGLRDMLAPVRDTPFVVFHDSLHYFEDRFGLTSAGAIAPGDASDPGPARIAQVRDIVRDLGVTCVLSEPAYNPALAQTVMDGTVGARLVEVDPMGSGIAPGQAFYPALLRAMAADLLACLE